MGKKKSDKKKSRSTCLSVDTVESVPEMINPPSLHPEVFRPPEGAFHSPLITVHVGKVDAGTPLEPMQVHRDVLDQSTVLRDMILELPSWSPVLVLDVSLPIFDLVLRYLYGSPFESCIRTLPSLSEHGTESEDSLQPLCEILCFTLTYRLEELSDQIASYIHDSSHVSYQSVLEAAKHVYTHAPSIELWFRDFVLQKTQEALADPSVADERWFVETFEHGYNGLSRELFECYKGVHKTSRPVSCTPTCEVTPTLYEDDAVDVADEASRPQPTQNHRQVVKEENLCTKERVTDELEHPMCDSTAEDRPQPLDARPAPIVIDRDPEASYETQHTPTESCPEQSTEEPYAEETKPATEALAEACSEDSVILIDNNESPTEPLQETFRYERSNPCSRRHFHLKQFARWSKCHNCRDELTAIARSAGGDTY